METKNGDREVAVTVPENPGLHVQPAGTLDPTLLAGQDTPGVSRDNRSSPWQEDVKKGNKDVGMMLPE